MPSEPNRRTFLRDTAALATAAALLPSAAEAMSSVKTSGKEPTMGAEERLRELKIELPPAPKPVATYTPAVRVGNLLFVSGHGPAEVPGVPQRGKAGGDLTTEQAKAAARAVGLNILSTVKSSVGSLDKVVRVVKVLGMVNAAAEFTSHPSVINGFSDLMVEVFGPPGKGARSAVGMGSLPGNIPVEIEAIFEVRD